MSCPPFAVEPEPHRGPGPSAAPRRHRQLCTAFSIACRAARGRRTPTRGRWRRPRASPARRLGRLRGTGCVMHECHAPPSQGAARAGERSRAAVRPSGGRGPMGRSRGQARRGSL